MGLIVFTSAYVYTVCIYFYTTCCIYLFLCFCFFEKVMEGERYIIMGLLAFTHERLNIYLIIRASRALTSYCRLWYKVYKEG